MTGQESLGNVIDAFKESVEWNLKQIKQDDAMNFDDEVSEWIFEAVDNEISGLSRTECMEIIDDFGGEDTIDKGLVDTSNLDKMVMTTAWAVLEQEVYSDNEISKLAEQLRGTVDYELAQELLKEIEA